VTFSAKQQRAIKRWISRAVPIKGLFFRSVEYRYMDPMDVLSGAGARAHGGRFAPIGTRAVYLSATDAGASWYPKRCWETNLSSNLEGL